MKNLFSLFLSQSYQDCWDDYNRSLKSKSFPQWDYIVLTASNAQQAEGFRKQIEERSGFLPAQTKFAVISDRDGKRVGSGGSTLSVLKYLHEQEGRFENLRVLVIHSGACRSTRRWASCSVRFRMSCPMGASQRCSTSS